LLAGCFSNNPDIDIRMRAAFDIIVSRLQKGREVMLPMAFLSPRESTIELTAMLAMVPNKPSYMHHSRSICSDQRKEDVGVHLTLTCSIPNH